MAIKLTIVFIMIVLSAIFSGTETAFTSLSLIQKKEIASKKSKSAKVASLLADKPDLLLTTILIGNNVVNIGVSSLVTTFTIDFFGSDVVGIATGILTLLILIFGEITPKQIAINYNVKIALFMAIPIKALTIVLFPIVFVFRKISNFISSIFYKNKASSISVEGIKHIVDVAEAEGVVDEYESELLEKVLYFSEIQAKTIMTHRSKIFRQHEDLTIKESFNDIIESGFSRIPLCRDNSNDIVGVLLLRDLLKELALGNNKTLKELKKNALYVPETLHIDELFKQFKRANLQLAVVIDEYGDLSGIITLEDIVEELFGELYDEHEKIKPDAIVDKDDGSYLIQADITLQAVIDELELEVEKEYRNITIAAYLMNKTEKLLDINDEIETSLGNFIIKKKQSRKVDEVLFIPKKREEE